MHLQYGVFLLVNAVALDTQLMSVLPILGRHLTVLPGFTLHFCNTRPRAFANKKKGLDESHKEICVPI
jgi:hypothetical protein